MGGKKIRGFDPRLYDLGFFFEQKKMSAVSPQPFSSFDLSARDDQTLNNHDDSWVVVVVGFFLP